MPLLLVRPACAIDEPSFIAETPADRAVFGDHLVSSVQRDFRFSGSVISPYANISRAARGISTCT
jgi:hypothetical protein